MRLIYLAGPYSHKEESVRRERLDQHAAAAAYFAHNAENLCVYSPIAHWSAIASRHDLPHDFNFWIRQDFFMIDKSAALWVLTIDGWKESYGLSQEIEFALDIQKPVYYVVREGTDYVLRDTRPD